MKHLLSSPFLVLLAAAGLAACSQKTPEVVDTNPDPMANVLATAPKVELPPTIKADNKAMRCKDNSLVYVTFFEGDKQALVRTEEKGTPTRLTAPEAGQPLTAEGGWKLTGNPTAIDVTIPGKGAKACHA